MKDEDDCDESDVEMTDEDEDAIVVFVLDNAELATSLVEETGGDITVLNGGAGAWELDSAVDTGSVGIVAPGGVTVTVTVMVEGWMEQIVLASAE